jgi:hypothetical protein
MAQWKALPDSLNKRVERMLSGGINTGSDALDIKDNQSVSEYGWDTDHFPSLASSAGRTTLGTSGSAATYLLTNYGNVELIRAVGTVLQRYTGGSWTPITGTFTATDWDASNFDILGPAVILTNGTDTVRYWNGTVLNSIAAAPKGKYIASDNRRVYIATKDVVNYCAFQNALDWTATLNAGVVQYYTPNGGDITALHAFNGQIWAFKKDSFCLIFHTGDSRVTHRLVEVSNNVGCVSHKTVVEVGDLLIWLGQDDVYIGAGGQARAIGEPIRQYLRDININHITKCNAYTDGLRYYLNLVTGANTEPNIRLMFDPRPGRQIWRVSQIGEKYRYGVFFNGKTYASNDTGQTYQVNTGTTNNGTAQSWLIETKDFDISEAEKEYYELHMQVYAPSGTTLTIKASVDQGVTYVTCGDAITGSSSAQNINIIIPLDTVPLGYWIRFKFTGSGEFRLYRFETYFRIQPVQI